ncbi:MAG: MOSC N-terminal beta barrel domain-containing protein [Opitutaceae bacterium]|jgi:uncharacterized protein YcbX
MRWQLRRIFIFPIKSLDGVSVDTARLTLGGILEHDRVFAIVDEQGKYVNGKRTAQIQRLRCAYDKNLEEVALREDGQASQTTFSLTERGPLARWLSDFFGFAVTVTHEPVGGFPDDRTAFGPTVVGEASLRTVADWYPGLSLESVRRRFRTNLEIDGSAAFAEDSLFGGPDERRPFSIGPVQFQGHNPCQRCVVPTRDPDTTAPIPNFQKTFMELRRQQLPPWADARRFNHYYRFAVNTSVDKSEAGKIIRVGDPVCPAPPSSAAAAS